MPRKLKKYVVVTQELELFEVHYEIEAETKAEARKLVVESIKDPTPAHRANREQAYAESKGIRTLKKVLRVDKGNW